MPQRAAPGSPHGFPSNCRNTKVAVAFCNSHFLFIHDPFPDCSFSPSLRAYTIEATAAAPTDRINTANIPAGDKKAGENPRLASAHLLVCVLPAIG